MGRLLIHVLKQMRTWGRWSIFSLEGYRLGQLLNGMVSMGPWQVVLSSIIFKKGVISWVKNNKNLQHIRSAYSISLWPNTDENNWEYADHMRIVISRRASWTATGGKNITYIRCISSYCIEKGISSLMVNIPAATVLLKDSPIFSIHR